MKLSTKLILLGITAPLVGLTAFLIAASSASIHLAKIAERELATLFENDYMRNIVLASSVIRDDIQSITRELAKDSDEINTILQSLRPGTQGQWFWKGSSLSIPAVAKRLQAELLGPMSLPSVTSTVFTRSSSGQWEKLTEVSQQRTTSEPAWKPDATYIEALNNAASGHNQHAKSKNLVLKQGTEWKPTRLTRISSPQSRHPIVLALAVNTDYASTFSKALSPGAYNGKKQFAFFDYRQGILNCIYEPQRSSACTSLAKAIRSSGLIASLNSPKAWPTPRQLKSRIEIQQPDGSTRQVPVRIVITRMTDWNAMAAISIEEDLFKQALMPVKEGIHYVNIFLTMTGLLLIGGCAFAAWRLSQRINGQLMLLANAANEIAEGHTNLQLEYKENDSIGALVNAFNRMASAVTDREDSLRERIETLEININHNLLVGQVCSITDSPEFSDLSRRAQLMRERRYRQLQKQNNNDES